MRSTRRDGASCERDEGLGRVASQTRREGSEQRPRQARASRHGLGYAEQRSDRATKYGEANRPRTAEQRSIATQIAPSRAWTSWRDMRRKERITTGPEEVPC